MSLDRFDLGSHTEEGKMTRNQSTKRKHDHEEHEEEGELDLATLKEHEEATKVTEGPTPHIIFTHATKAPSTSTTTRSMRRRANWTWRRLRNTRKRPR